MFKKLTFKSVGEELKFIKKKAEDKRIGKWKDAAYVEKYINKAFEYIILEVRNRAKKGSSYYYFDWDNVNWLSPIKEPKYNEKEIIKRLIEKLKAEELDVRTEQESFFKNYVFYIRW